MNYTKTTILLTGLTIISISITLGHSQSTLDDIPKQDPSKVEIHPEIERQFQQTEGLFGTQGSEEKEILISLQRYDSDVTRIEEMKEKASESQEPLEKLAENEDKLDIKNQFWITNLVILEAKTDSPLEDVASVRGVRKIGPDAKFRTLDDSTTLTEDSFATSEEYETTYGLDQINATSVWSEFGSKGEDVRVSVIDTGIDESHQDLALYTDDETDETFPGGWAEFNDGEVEGSEPRICDYGGGDHGTHVSGTVAGGDSSGRHIGVAPNVELMNVGALMAESETEDEEEEGECVGGTSDLIGGMEWSIENDADIISMSLGSPCEDRFGNRVYNEDFIDAVNNAEQNNTMVVAATGNEGEGCSSSPGNVFDAWSVGASDVDREIAEFSGGEEIDTEDAWGLEAPNEWPDEYIIPSVSAPGVFVESSEPGDDYGFKSGTSMATPHVSGSAALIQSATSEDLSPEQIKESFNKTAKKPDSDTCNDHEIRGRDSRCGKGIIDTYKATDYAVSEFDNEAGKVDSYDVVQDVSDSVVAGDSAVFELEATDENGTVNEDYSKTAAITTTQNSDIDITQEFSSGTISVTEDLTTAVDDQNIAVEEEDSGDFTTMSSQFDVESAEADSVEIDSDPDETQTAGEIIIGEPAGKVTDEFENVVEDVDVEVEVIEESASITAGETTVSTGVEGIATFDDLEIEQAGEDYRLEFSIDGGNDKTAETDSVKTVEFDIEPADADEITSVFNDSPKKSGETVTITIEAQDLYGNDADGDQVSVQNTDGLSDLNGQSETLNDGEAIFQFSESNADVYNPKFELDNNNDQDQSTEVTIEASEAEKLNIVSQPNDSVAGNTIEGPVISVTDSEDNAVEGVNVTASLNESDTDMDGDKQVSTDSSGEVNFNDLSINETGIYTLNFSIDEDDNNVENNVSQESDSLTVSAAEAHIFEFSQKVDEMTAGDQPEFTVTALDQFGNPSTNHSGFDDFINIEAGNLIDNPIDMGADEENSSFEWNITEKGNHTVSTDSEIEDTEHTVEVSPGSISADNSLITAGNTSIIASEQFNTTVTVEALDSFGNKLQKGGDAGDISLSTDNGNLIDELTDEEDGNYTQSLQAANELGAANVTGEVGEEPIDDNAIVDFVAGEASEFNSSIENQGATADGTDIISVDLTIEDDFDNPIEDHSITASKPENLTIQGDNPKDTDSSGETSLDFASTDSGSFTVNFTTENSLEKSEELEFSPGPPHQLEINGVNDEQKVGEKFNITVKAFDENNNIATSYHNKTGLSLDTINEHVKVEPGQTTNLTDGRLNDFSVTVENNQTLNDINLEASDSSVNTGTSRDFNLTEPIPPEIDFFDTNASLILEDESLDIEINTSVYEFEQGDSQTNLNVTEPGESENTVTLDGSREDVDWNASYQPQDGLGDYNLTLDVEDVFSQSKNLTQNFSVREPRGLQADVNRSIPDWRVKESSGKVRDQDQGDINTTIPRDDSWEVEIEESSSSVTMKDLNVTTDVSGEIEFQSETTLEQDIELFDENKTLAIDSDLEFKEADISAEADSDTVYRCGDWDFDSESCSDSWSEVDGSAITHEEGITTVTVESFSAYSFGNEEEEEDNGDDGNGRSGGSSDSSSGNGGAGGFGGTPDSIEPNVEEIENAIRVTVPEGNHSLQFNESGLPIRSLEIDAPQERSLNFTRTSLDHSGSMEDIFDAETNFDGHFTLEVELSKDWMEENLFELGQTSLYSLNGEWRDLNPLVDEKEDYIVFTATLSEASEIGVGANQVCHSMEEVSAVEGDSCQIYDNPCELSEDAQEVESCSEWDRRSNITSEIDRLRGEESVDRQKLEDAEQALEQRDFETAERLLEEAQQTGLPTPSIDISIRAIAFSVLFIVALIGSGIKLKPIYRRRKLKKRATELTTTATQKANNEENFQETAEMAAKANEALIEGELDKAEKILNQAEETE